MNANTHDHLPGSLPFFPDRPEWQRQATYRRPKQLHEASRLLTENEHAVLIAGGTDILIRQRMGFIRPLVYIDVRDCVPRTITVNSTGARIGGACTLTQIRTDPALRPMYTVLVEAASRLGGPQIQNAGTIGGNLGNASPAADAVCALTALDADIHLASHRGNRVVPIRDFLRGPGHTALERGEIIEWIQLTPPVHNGDCHQSYHKVGARNAMVCSLAAVAGVTTLEGPVVQSTRLALAAVGPTCMRAAQTEAFLGGKTLDDATCLAAAEMAAQEARPIGDHRASLAYRRELVRALVLEHLTGCRRLTAHQ